MPAGTNSSFSFPDSELCHVIVTSDEPWSAVWMPQLHYAYQLSRRCNVIFLGPPEPWTLKSLFRFRYKPEKYNDRLLRIRYLNVLPLSLGNIALRINDWINERVIRKTILSGTTLPDLIAWRFDMIRSIFLFDDRKEARQVFHVIDPIVTCEYDKPLSRSAELVIVTSPKFIDHYRALNNNVLQIAQGVDLDFYMEPARYSEGDVAVSKDSVLLLGSFTDDINYLLLKKIAKQVPNNLVLIGPKRFSSDVKEGQFDDLIKENKVHWLGAMEPVAFRPHLDACKAGIICYDHDINANNKLRSPLKAIGYLAAGKCIISNIDCEIPSLVGKAIYNVDDDNSFFPMISKIYSGELNFDKIAVEKYLKSIDYNTLLAGIFEKLNKKLPPKI